MINYNPLKADIIQILREPILIVFIFMPLLAFFVLKIFILYFSNFLQSNTGFNLLFFSNYILSASFVMIANLLGTVFGFLMLDERDSNITKFMVITPMGYFGYIANRTFLPVLGCIIYTFLGYFILNIYNLSFLKLILISILLGIESILICLTLFLIADDKVKGLTYAKALSLVTLLTLADLMNSPWIKIIASLFPFYWITKIINSPINITSVMFYFVASLFIHGLWLSLYMFIIRIKKAIG